MFYVFFCLKKRNLVFSKLIPEKMKKKDTNTENTKPDNKNKTTVPSSLLYPPSDDIYNKYREETEINPEDVSINKIPVEKNLETDWNIKNFESDMSGSDLDIPGSEFDDSQETIGSEDEENNHYSIGGDNHTNLDENSSESYPRQTTTIKKRK